MKKIIYLLSFLLASAGLSAQTVVDVIGSTGEHTTLEAAIIAAELDGTLSGEGPFTIFAPTDDAFGALPPGTVDALLANIPALTDILLYHAVAGNVLSTDLSNGFVATINGSNVLISIEGSVTVNDANVTGADNVATNGVVHIIDAVLLPPPATVVDIILESDVHNTLALAVSEAGLVETLQGEGPFTVFAPTDAAFDALPDGVLDAVLADEELLTAILTYHVVGGNVLSTDLSNGFVATVNGSNVLVSISDDGVFINNAQVIVADLFADNGVVHVIDAVLTPPPATVVDIILESDVHTTLALAVTEAGLVETLEGEGPFTVFAPTDAAFDALPDGVLDAVLADEELLTSILTYHVAAGAVLSSDLMDEQMITTVNGAEVMVTINDDGVFINDAQVIVADLFADNGVVHVIDAILLPPPTTVVDVILGSDVHMTLAAAIDAAGLIETLQGEGPFTVFAPTDEAFDALPDGTLDALLADIPALTAILTYHVVGGNVMSTDLEGGFVATLNGSDILVSITDDGIFINGAQVILADIEADNGVVHVIDAVLLPPPATVVDIILESDVHTTLADAVVEADLVETLQGEGPFTVFAPTDAAFDALPDGALDALLADVDALTAVLTYHVVGGSVLSTDLEEGFVMTVNGSDILVTINDEGVFINSAQVIIADIFADNGVVHVIDAVLLPPPATVVDIILESDVHTTLATAVAEAGLVETLQGEGPFTVFAPTDAAFDALPDGALDALLADIDALTAVLTYHVVGGFVMSTDLEEGFVMTLNGSDVLVTINDDGIFINNAQVIIADIFADNGVVHVIDAVLTPPPATVVDIILESDVHTTLALAVGEAGLVETLQGEGPFTVFAPTDAAFDALPEGTLDALLADPDGLLTDILLYHVVPGFALSSDLMDGQELITVNGESVTVTINGDGVFINDAQVIIADLIADNGVVHVIDAVLLPPAEPFTVVDIILASPIHQTLATAVAAAGLVETLQGEGPFTVFAPTDEAFDALPDGVLDALLADPSGALTEVLLYHVVSGAVLSTDLSDGAVPTLQGDDVVVDLSGGMVMINDATVILADLEADNGVVHVIDVVLTPPSSVEESNPIGALNLYPNPAREFMTISGDVPAGAMINVYDNAGRSVYTSSFNGYTNLNVSDFSQGMYMIMIVADNAIRAERFIVE